MPAPSRGARAIASSPTATTALGGDNRTGCAVLVTLAATLHRTEAAAPADHAAVHGARGERPAGRPRARSDGPRRRRRWASTSTASSAPELIIGASGRTAGRSRSSARRRTPALRPRRGISATLVGGLGPGRGAARGLVRQGREGRTARAPAIRRSSAARTAGCRRRHQRRDGLRLRQRRGAEPGRRHSPRQSPKGIARRLPKPPGGEGRRRRDSQGEIRTSPSYPPFNMKDDEPVSPCEEGRGSARPEADDCFFQRRARCQLARSGMACRPSPSARDSTKSIRSGISWTSRNSPPAADWPSFSATLDG